jgi:hypothetical protein
LDRLAWKSETSEFLQMFRFDEPLEPVTRTSNLDGWNAGWVSSRFPLFETTRTLAYQAQPCPVMTPASMCRRIDCAATDPLVEIRHGEDFRRSRRESTSDGWPRRYVARSQLRGSQGKGNRNAVPPIPLDGPHVVGVRHQRADFYFAYTRKSMTSRSTP